MTSEPEDFVDDENGEITLGDTQPSPVKNGRPFLAIAISIGIIVLLALACTIGYAFFSFSPPTSPQRQYLATSVAQANHAVQQAQTFARFLINQNETPGTVDQGEIAISTPTSTPTQTAPEQTATFTPVPEISKTPTAIPTATKEELTPVAEAVVDTPTSSANGQQTIEPTNSDVTPTGEGPVEVQRSVKSPTPGITEEPTASITLEAIKPTWTPGPTAVEEVTTTATPTQAAVESTKTPEPTAVEEATATATPTLAAVEPTKTTKQSAVEEATATPTQATETAVEESTLPTRRVLPETGVGDHLNLPLFLGMGFLFLCLFILARWLRLTWQR